MRNTANEIEPKLASSEYNIYFIMDLMILPKDHILTLNHF